MLFLFICNALNFINHILKKHSKLGWRDGSAVKVLAMQADIVYSVQKTHSGRREPSPESSPLTSMFRPTHTIRMHTLHTQTLHMCTQYTHVTYAQTLHMCTHYTHVTYAHTLHTDTTHAHILHTHTYYSRT